jgi:hypothetical protein
MWESLAAVIRANAATLERVDFDQDQAYAPPVVAALSTCPRLSNFVDAAVCSPYELEGAVRLPPKLTAINCLCCRLCTGGAASLQVLHLAHAL